IRQPKRGRPSNCSPGAAAITPSRSITQPARKRRRYALNVLIDRSDLPAGMQRSDAAGVIAPGNAGESSLADHIGKVLLVRKRTDGFDQIPVGVRIAGNHTANARNGIERPRVVNLVEDRHADFGKFEAKEA